MAIQRDHTSANKVFVSIQAVCYIHSQSDRLVNEPDVCIQQVYYRSAIW